MTNYNERLDEIFYQYRDEYNAWQANPRGSGTNGIKLQNRAKQAITSLNKELVAEAKPGNVYKTSDGQVPETFEAPAHAYDVAIQDFEQNLLKALEESK